MDFIVGTFNTPYLFTLRFTPPQSPLQSTTQPPQGQVRILARHDAIGSHSWLALSPSKTNLYATAWTEPPSIAAYALERAQSDPESGVKPRLINTAPTSSRSGYVCASERCIYSAGGPTGEVFRISPSSGVGDLMQKLSFIGREMEAGTGSDAVPHGDFGGLRHGAHSVDLSPDGRSLYVADIGRNCVWAFKVGDETIEAEETRHLILGRKVVATRTNDGPRHTTPHPNGKVLYVLQEHSCMVDVYSVADDGVTLEHLHGVRIIPEVKDEKEYWADEVRVSTGSGEPRYLFASTRGLKAETKGYVAVFALDGEGMVQGQALDIWETPTSGGWANAVEPAPGGGREIEWIALIDSEEGWVFVLGFDGRRLWEAARCKLKGDDGTTTQGAATAVWL